MIAAARPMPTDTQAAVGALEAQRLVAAIRAGDATATHAWLTLVDLAAVHGSKSVACAAFVKELAKHAVCAPELGL